MRSVTRICPGSPTILFLHGLAGHSGEWDQVCSYLDGSVGFIAPDLRGHGSNWDGTDIDVSVSGFIDDALSLIAESGPGSVVIVGQSMGGLVAMSLAARHPELVAHLVLIEAGIRPSGEDDLAGLTRWFDSWPVVFESRDQAMEFFGVDKPSSPAWVDGLAVTQAGLERRFDPQVMIRTMRALATSRSAEWASLDVPTTLITGSDGAMTGDEVAEMAAIRPDIHVIEIVDSGHDVHLDQPQEVAAVLQDILHAVELD